ncbi:MAG: rhomboid family intramembrane serine protease [Lachnospira sp.]|nr:rhomboid family intramembrane serine protease [Lachnospira sp.]
MKRYVPYVTIALVLVNVLIFYIMSVSGNYNQIVEKYAMYAPAVENGEWYRIFTHMFLHADTRHLFNNMLMLAAVGYSIEDDLGHIKYAIIYFVGGLGACALSAYYDVATQNYVLSLGASGAIMAIFGAMIVLTIRNRSSFDKTVGIRSLIVLAIMVFGNMSAGVDWMAHLGGAITGLILGFVLTIGYKKRI